MNYCGILQHMNCGAKREGFFSIMISMSKALTAEEARTPEKMKESLPPMFTDTLTLNHRCDGCGAPAVSQILVGDTVLLLCGHHTRQSLETLAEAKYLTDIPEEASYQFTDREIERRTRKETDHGDTRTD